MPKHSSSAQRSKDDFFDTHKAEIVSLGAWVVMIHAILFWDWLGIVSKTDNASSWMKAGQFGDFVGGYIGTLFAIGSVVLLFLTFKSQRQVASSEAFESRYFELLKMHRENVAEVELQKSTGRKVFVLLMREFRAIHALVNQEASALALTLTNLEKCQIAYYCLYCGIGPNSSRILRAYLRGFPAALVDALELRLGDREVRNEVTSYRKLGYEPFEGHQSRLGHYYRHLYQCVDYINRSPDHNQRYSYVKILRAQLSTHEQALLLLNSLTPMGNAWWESGFIQLYRMVQNIPKSFFDPTSELDLEGMFGFDSLYFEWQESDAA